MSEVRSFYVGSRIVPGTLHGHVGTSCCRAQLWARGGGGGVGGGGGGGGGNEYTAHSPTPTDIRHTATITAILYSRPVATLVLYETNYTYLWKVMEI